MANTKYIQEWKREKYKIWKADIPKEEKEEYDRILKKLNLTKPEFLKKAFELIRKELDN